MCDFVLTSFTFWPHLFRFSVFIAKGKMTLISLSCLRAKYEAARRGQLEIFIFIPEEMIELRHVTFSGVAVLAASPCRLDAKLG